MDGEFSAGLMSVSPSEVKAEPVSPGPVPLLHLKTEPGLSIKQEEDVAAPAQPSLLKPPPTILISSRPAHTNARVLYPKLPVKMEPGGTGAGWKLSSTKFLVNTNQSSSVQQIRRRAIDSQLISSNTVSGSMPKLYFKDKFSL